MCDYVPKKKLVNHKKMFIKWVGKVQKELKKDHKIRFAYNPIGSGKRNMVIKQCNRQEYDLDYNLKITRLPKEWSEDIYKCCKKLKDTVRTTFDKYKPSGFSDMEDSTQALTTKNIEMGFGYDVIITIVIDNIIHILYNKKNTNDANNNDYEWEPRSEFVGVTSNIKKIKGPEMWNALRSNYLDKRHKYKDQQEPNKKKSYQILNESINEILKAFEFE